MIDIGLFWTWLFPPKPQVEDEGLPSIHPTFRLVVEGRRWARRRAYRPVARARHHHQVARRRSPSMPIPIHRRTS